jgi:hypothetical protein
MGPNGACDRTNDRGLWDLLEVLLPDFQCGTQEERKLIDTRRRMILLDQEATG